MKPRPVRPEVFLRGVTLSPIAPLAGLKSYEGEATTSSTKPPEGAWGLLSNPMPTFSDMYTTQILHW